MIRRQQTVPVFATLGLLVVWSALFKVFWDMGATLRDFKVEFPALSVFTVHAMHLFNGLALPGAVGLIAVFLWRRAGFSWYSALGLCFLCDALTLGTALPMLALRNSLGAASLPSSALFVLTLSVAILLFNQVLLALLVLKRREFLAR